MDLYKQLCSDKFLISGPCVIESETSCLDLAESISKVAEKHGFKYLFKASFDKANRTSIDSYRGPGIEEGLRILEKVKKEFNLSVVTDIHEPDQAKIVAEVCDVLQIPAFLCRQTDLLLAAGKTDKIVNIKKAQFLSGKDMIYPIKKIIDGTGNNKLMLTERGTFFGYDNLVVDYKGFSDMLELGVPTIMDVTHSTQRPGAQGGKSGGERKYALPLALAAAAVGASGYFFEVHQDPDNAKSDGPNMLTPRELDAVLEKVAKISL